MGPLLPPAAAIMAAPSSRVVAALPLFNMLRSTSARDMTCPRLPMGPGADAPAGAALNICWSMAGIGPWLCGSCFGCCFVFDFGFDDLRANLSSSRILRCRSNSLIPPAPPPPIPLPPPTIPPVPKISKSSATSISHSCCLGWLRGKRPLPPL